MVKLSRTHEHRPGFVLRLVELPQEVTDTLLGGHPRVPHALCQKRLHQPGRSEAAEVPPGWKLLRPLPARQPEALVAGGFAPQAAPPLGGEDPWDRRCPRAATPHTARRVCAAPAVGSRHAVEVVTCRARISHAV